MAEGLITRTEAEVAFNEACRTLHDYIGLLVAKYGSMVDTDYNSLATPPVRITPGWDVMLYEASEEELEVDPPLPSEPRDKLDILVTPAEAPGGGYIIPHLTERAQFWISVGTDGARRSNRHGSRELSTDEVQHVEHELRTIVAPQLETGSTEL